MRYFVLIIVLNIFYTFEKILKFASRIEDILKINILLTKRMDTRNYGFFNRVFKFIGKINS